MPEYQYVLYEPIDVPKVVAERLGHANAAMTLNVYAHLWPDDEDRSRQAIDEALDSS